MYLDHGVDINLGLVILFVSMFLRKDLDELRDQGNCFKIVMVADVSLSGAPKIPDTVCP